MQTDATLLAKTPQQHATMLRLVASVCLALYIVVYMAYSSLVMVVCVSGLNESYSAAEENAEASLKEARSRKEEIPGLGGQF